jgi:hypothetical protein
MQGSERVYSGEGGGMRKRGMSLNRKKLKEKVKQLENENKALVIGLQVLRIAGAVQMEAMRSSYESHLSLAKTQFSEGGVVPMGENEGCLLNKEQEQRLRDALSEMINKEMS